DPRWSRWAYAAGGRTLSRNADPESAPCVRSETIRTRAPSRLQALKRRQPSTERGGGPISCERLQADLLSPSWCALWFDGNGQVSCKRLVPVAHHRNTGGDLRRRSGRKFEIGASGRSRFERHGGQSQQIGARGPTRPRLALSRHGT